MARLLFYSVPLAAAGISSWRWYLRSPDSPKPPPRAAEPVFIPSRFPPLEADDSAATRPPSVLQLQARPLARLRAGDASQRREAAAALAGLRGLTDADWRQLAQTLDHRTALTLAGWRAGDVRLFLPPPRAAAGDADGAALELRLRRLLESLPPGEPCAEFWRARALRHPPSSDWEPAPLAEDAADVGAPPPWRAAPAVAVETDCLRALMERAESAPQRRAMLAAGALQLLASAHAQRPRDAARSGMLARTIGAGLGSARQLHQAGWLGLLAAWSREEDVRVGPHAWRVVRNLALAEGLLDVPEPAGCAGARRPSPDGGGGGAEEDSVTAALVALDARWAALRSRVRAAAVAAGLPVPSRAAAARRTLRPLPAGVLVLHPRGLAEEADTEVDVVLVHGLLGGTDRTWRQADAARAALPPPREPTLSELVLPAGDVTEAASDVTEAASDVIRPSGDSSGDSSGEVRNFNSGGVVGESKSNASESRTVNHTSGVVLPNGGSCTPESVANSSGKSPATGRTAPSGIPHRTSASPASPSPTEEITERYTQCWPRDWLPVSLLPLRVRVLSVDYDSAWSDWRPRCAARRARSLSERAEELGRQLREAGVGDRPVVWVAHSMGGLLVKQLLVEADRAAEEVTCSGGGASDAGDMMRGASSNTGSGGGSGVVSASGITGGPIDSASHRPSSATVSPVTSTALCPLLSATRGVLFLSCPHAGSSLASSLSGPLRPLLLPSAELHTLRRHSPPLLQLRREFAALCRRRRVACLSVAETRPLPLLGRPVLFVDRESAEAGVGEVIEVEEDHLTVCKPRDRDSRVYQLVVRFVTELCSQKRD